MIEKPNIADEKIITALQDNYSIPVVAVEFLPLGLDSSAWAYRVDAENDTYFLKIRKEISNQAGILLPRFLKEQGIEQVIAPLSTRKGEAWETVDGFSFILYPFITGQKAMDVGMSDVHWVEFGSVLKRLHTVKLTPEFLSAIKRERFVPQRIDWVKENHAQVKSCEYDDPFQKELAGFWRGKYSTISTILQRTEALAKKVLRTDLEFVLCHADIHTANVLITEDDRIFIVDWDETMFAPKERDLMFVAPGVFTSTVPTKEEGLFFEGYGETEVNALALAYYRYDWCVEDIGAFAERVFVAEDAGEETQMNSIEWFKHLFARGSSVEIAINTQIEI